MLGRWVGVFCVVWGFAVMLAAPLFPQMFGRFSDAVYRSLALLFMIGGLLMLFGRSSGYPVALLSFAALGGIAYFSGSWPLFLLSAALSVVVIVAEAVTPPISEPVVLIEELYHVVRGEGRRFVRRRFAK
ncbi:MAG: hypothetical protein QXJ59_05305 [Thermofilaceae archaeon]